MNETFLNVRGADEVLTTVRRCWASLFGARTVFYRAKRGFGQADMDIAVIVQQQVDPARSGVMFTIDPASGNLDQLVIEAAFGLGESVVSGNVSPDRYVIDEPLLAIVSREVRRKELTVEPRDDGGTVRRALDDVEAVAPVLTDEEVRALAELGCGVETHYRAPQDTEWAIDPNRVVWLLQSRPVTATGHAGRAAAENAAEREVLARGLGAVPGLAGGPVRVVTTRERAQSCVTGRCSSRT
jgi:pyruvate,water dikinase